MSRFNDLYQGTATEAADALDYGDGRSTAVTDPALDNDVRELRVALINALRRIAALEEKMRRATLAPEEQKERPLWIR